MTTHPKHKVARACAAALAVLSFSLLTPAQAADKEEWPGSQTESPLDSEDDNRDGWSGLDYEASGTGAVGTLWAVVDNGTLLKLTESGGSWEQSQQWTLRYPDGSGTVDAEGVTLADDGYIYVSSERNIDDSETSRLSVLKYKSSDSGELTAVTEWNLSDDFPDADANSGLEGITWIPDTYLTEQGLVDENTDAAYSPDNYSNHGSGLFAVSVEETAGVYLYALAEDGTATQIASMETDFDTVAELEFDADLGGLWVVCDDACKGKTATFEINSGGEFEQTALYARPDETENFANEGFTIADSSQADNGQIPTYYADDANTDGHSLRQGALNTSLTASDTGTTASASSTAADEQGDSLASGWLLPAGIVAVVVLLAGATTWAVLRKKR